MAVGKNIKPLPRSIAEAGKRILDTNEITSRFSLNGGYSQQTERELLHILSWASDEVIYVLKDILAYDPEYPKGLSFSEAWCIDEHSLATLSASEETRLKKVRQALQERAMEVYSLEDAEAFANSKAWDESKFRKWQEEYWNPICQMEKDSLQRVLPGTFDEYFRNLTVNLTTILKEIKQRHMRNIGLASSGPHDDSTGHQDVVSLFDEAKRLFTIWNEIQWDSTKSALLLRGNAYFPAVDETGPLLASQEIGDAPEHLNMWKQLRERFPDEDVRKRECLRNLNLKVYGTIKREFEQLEPWKSGDDEKIQKIRAVLKNDGWTGDNYKEQRWYSRYMERMALVRGMDDIMTFLKKSGYDAEGVIATFLKEDQALATEPDRDKCEPLTTIGDSSPSHPKKAASLFEAGNACHKLKLGKSRKKQLIDICERYLSTHTIEGKPDYTKEKLANYVSSTHRSGI